MKMKELTAYRKNLALKKAFKELGLSPSEVIDYTSFDLDLENQRLENLLTFIRKYEECGRNQQVMELIGHPFPPIFPMISPENDWYRFDLWLDGQPLSGRLWDQIGRQPPEKPATEMNDEEIERELEGILEAMDRAQLGLGVNKVPPRVLYLMLIDYLAEDHLPIGSGGWVFDGCGGYCPGCLQRPWCDSGSSSCWPEDERAGKMHFPEELRELASPSPQSLDILRACQREEDEAFEAIRRKRRVNERPEEN